MFYSRKFNILFIACPKTGSRTVENVLNGMDPEGEKFSITLMDRKITSNQMPNGLLGHARARAFENVFGNKRYKELTIFGFVRDPLDSLVSSYFFNRQCSLKKTLAQVRDKIIYGRRTFYSTLIKRLLTESAAKVLPFKLWVLIYPRKTNKEYFTNTEGKIIVDYLGRTDHLNEDLKVILKQIRVGEVEIPHSNQSSHRHYKDYFKNKFIYNYVVKKYKDDMDFYAKVSNNVGIQIRNL